MSFISSIGTAVPGTPIRQSQLAEFMIRAMRLDTTDARRLQAIFRASGIQTRHSVIEDYRRTEGFRFFPEDGQFEPFPSTHQRMAAFQEHALHLSLRAVEDCLRGVPSFDSRSITHLITVSCTGMYAPGLDIDLVKSLKLNPTVARTQINFMGCFAGLTAIRLADTIANGTQANVLVVCCELCSLHFQKENTEDNFFANALFADGAGAVLVQSSVPPGFSLRCVSFHSDLAPEGEHDMAWAIGDTGFRMKLSTYVPEILHGSLGPFIDAIRAGVSGDGNIRHYAIHPGGRKILKSVEDRLGVKSQDDWAAHEVLGEFGNMSSPTVLFVLKRLWRTLGRGHHNERILSFAFGPGLTLESGLFEIHVPK